MPKHDFTSQFKKRKKKPPLIQEVEISDTKITKSSRHLETNRTINKQENRPSNEHTNISKKQIESTNMVTRTFDLPKEVVFRLKLESALSGKYMNEILVESLKWWFDQHGQIPESLLKLKMEQSDNEK